MYDYVIVGAGSAGCVVAARLSEDPDVKVCLLEAGGPDTAPEIHMPAAFPAMFKSGLDWDLLGEQEPGLDNRRLYLPRGKMLGGSGSINAMIYIRGNRADYDEWEAGGAEGRRDDQAAVERALDPVGGGTHGERADDRGDDRDAAHDQRVQGDLAGEVAGEGEHAEEHHRDRGDRVGLEEVGRHPGAVADVVADVVGDHRGVARVVLGDPGLDLPDEVGADVGGLREDPAAEAGEDRDQRAAEAEADERVDGLLVGCGRRGPAARSSRRPRAAPGRRPAAR